MLSRGDVQAEERQGLLHGNGTRREQEAQETEPQRADKRRRDKGVDLVGWSLVKEPDFVLLFLIMTMISGTGLLVINVSGGSGRRGSGSYGRANMCALSEHWHNDPDVV